MDAIMTTLCYLERDGKYLMLLRNRKKKDINKGKWIGVGGKFEQGESPEECARREVLEETGLTLHEARFRALITFVTAQGMDEYMCLFTSEKFSGEEHPCDEGELAWIPKEEIPSLNLWDGDRIFLRLLSEDAPFFSLKLVYDEEGKLVRARLNGEDIGELHCYFRTYRDRFRC